MTDDYRSLLKQHTLDEASFVQLTLSGQVKGQVVPWRKIVIRPVVIKQRPHWQFSYFDAKQDLTKNYRDAEVEAHLDEALALPFSLLQLRSTLENLDVQITKKGKAIVHRSAPSVAAPDLSHDAAKALPIPADQPDLLLQQLGIMNARGEIKPSMHGKFAQMNEFLKLLEHTGELDHFDTPPVNILDCGCGSAYLTFALHHYLNHLRGLPATITGIDTNAVLIDKSRANSAALGLNDLCFTTTAIREYVPAEPPDIVLALHACDTATDDALVQGIRHEARLIVCVPCCHHHLNDQLTAVAPFEPVMRHGILKERLADMLTDTFRALVLRILGYKTDVIEFISSEHTHRNVMIRAVKRAPIGEAQFVEEYRALKSFWGVTPYIETALSDEFAALVG